MIFISDSFSKIPQETGVYQFLDSNNGIIYIGKAVNLKKRILSYFKKNIAETKTNTMVSRINKVSIIITSNEFEALILEAKLIKKHKPKFNISIKDDKQYIYIKVTKEEFPKIIISRKDQSPGKLYGPFPSTYIVKDLIRHLRQIFPFCTQKYPYKKICLYREIDLCNPCPYEIITSSDKKGKKLASQYRDNIRRIVGILEGNLKEIKIILEKEMNNLALNERFEEAAQVRDRLMHLEKLTSRKFYAEDYIANPQIAVETWKKEQSLLKEILNKEFNKLFTLHAIECYDISNLSGKLATGSMVTFTDGKPDKNRYRHFRIKGKPKANDYAMLREVFERRLKHREWELPDLFIVDGGSQQLDVLLNCLAYFKLNIPGISLAKRYEEIYLKKDGQYKLIRLKNNDGALKLVQRLRDEAHRFAHHYHLKLRIKNLLPTSKKSLK